MTNGVSGPLKVTTTIFVSAIPGEKEPKFKLSGEKLNQSCDCELKVEMQSAK
jgi:hypothetical protein